MLNLGTTGTGAWAGLLYKTGEGGETLNPVRLLWTQQVMAGRLGQL